MITIKEAIAAFSKKYGDLTIVNLVDYDDKWYIITALEDPSKPSYSDPHYAVSKKDGSIVGFYPSTEIAKFSEAVLKRSVDLKTLQPNRSTPKDDIRHAADAFDALKESYLMHSDEMTADQAYAKVCDFVHGKPGVAICRDYEDYFGFFLLPPGAKKGERVFVGREMIVVDKLSGKVFYQGDDDSVNLYGKRWRSVKGSFGG